MAGCGDEMPVTGMDVEIIKAFVRSKGIGHDTTHATAELAEDFIGQEESAFALEALEEGGYTNGFVMLFGEQLEEVTSALKDAKATPHTGFEPEGIVESGAVATVFRSLKKLGKRLEKFFPDD